VQRRRQDCVADKSAIQARLIDHVYPLPAPRQREVPKRGVLQSSAFRSEWLQHTGEETARWCRR